MARFELDQWSRQGFPDLAAPSALTDVERETWQTLQFDLMCEFDQANAGWLTTALDRHGWPTRDAWGPKSERAAVMLALHADHDRALQSRVITSAQSSGSVSPKLLAVFEDRLAHQLAQTQSFGTQGECAHGVWRPFPIKAPDGVDARRRNVGLEDLATYTNRMSAGCRP